LTPATSQQDDVGVSLDDRNKPPPRPDRSGVGPTRNVVAEADRLARENSQKRAPKPKDTDDRQGKRDNPNPNPNPNPRDAREQKPHKPLVRKPQAPINVDGPSTTSPMDLVAVEFEELLRGQSLAWRAWPAAQKLTVLSSLVMLLGTLLPWITTPGRPHVLGVAAGGVFHALLGVASIALVAWGERDVQRQTRAALYQLLLGIASSGLGVWFVVAYGLERQSAPLTIRFGLYVTLAAGMLLSYGGFARFRVPTQR
jgi:hypothetical protein